MAKVQTRRTVSVSGVTYARLREFCATDGRSMSVVTEAALASVIGTEAPPPLPLRVPNRSHGPGRPRYVVAAGVRASLARWAEWLGVSRERARQLANRGLLAGRIEAECAASTTPPPAPAGEKE